MSNKLNIIKDSGQISSDSSEQFWMESYPKLQQYCQFLTQNKWDGDDVAQETFLKAMKHYKQISPALLNKIAYHHWIDTVRKRKRETIGVESVVGAIKPSVETIQTVDLMLGQFTPKQAIIFLLKEAFRYQAKEIAEILGTTETAVKANILRSRKRLEKGLNQEQQDYSVEPFWNETTRESLSELIQTSLQAEDPTILIESIPSLLPEAVSVPNMMSRVQKLPAVTPSSTLCMAAA